MLRLVQSNVPNAPEWDGFYDGTNSGWESFFRTLRHYLEHHRGKPRATKVVGKLELSLEEARTRVTSAVRGDVVFSQPSTQLEIVVHELGDAYLAHSMSSRKRGSFVYSILSLYGTSPDQAAAIRADWEPRLKAALGMRESKKRKVKRENQNPAVSWCSGFAFSLLTLKFRPSPRPARVRRRR